MNVQQRPKKFRRSQWLEKNPSSPSLLLVPMQNRQRCRQRRLEYALLFQFPLEGYCMSSKTFNGSTLSLFFYSWTATTTEWTNQRFFRVQMTVVVRLTQTVRENARKLSWTGEERAAVLLCCARGWDDNVYDKKILISFPSLTKLAMVEWGRE